MTPPRKMFRKAAAACALLLPAIASAQVICTMPNGVETTHKLASECPQGAIKARTPDGKPAPIRGQQASPAPSGPEVKAADFGARWPLTINSGTLRCNYPVPGNHSATALTISAGGKTYALNGTARGHAAKNGWLEINPIWRDNPGIPGTKIPITPLIERASQLCTSAQPPDPEAEFTQARQLCAWVESMGIARCTVKTSWVDVHELQIKAVGTRDDFINLCYRMQNAAQKIYPAVVASQRGWQATIEHGVNSAIFYRCKMSGPAR